MLLITNIVDNPVRKKNPKKKQKGNRPDSDSNTKLGDTPSGLKPRPVPRLCTQLRVRRLKRYVLTFLYNLTMGTHHWPFFARYAKLSLGLIVTYQIYRVKIMKRDNNVIELIE